MYIGIDLGTSGIKIILMDEEQKILKTLQHDLLLSHPYPLWSEQDPNQWWSVTDSLMLKLASQVDLSSVKAIGLTGQMHGAVLLDKHGNILRPAILWNDGRCYNECIELEQIVTNSRQITGNLMMPGFTAPKLKWLKKYEPAIFSQIHKVLLPKDFIRFKMTGVYASDMSDASGSMWLDVNKRRWNEELLHASDLSLEHMPQLFEGTQITGQLSKSLAIHWQIKEVPIVAGGGDNAAGAIGMGIYKSNQAMLSLGTSGVYFVVSDKFTSQPEQAVHSFCHAIENTWHLMSVMLSATSCVNWYRNLIKKEDISVFFSEIEQCHDEQKPVYFLPYLSGERTPYNNPNATGCFWGLTHQHDNISLAKAVILGVSYALINGIEVLEQTGSHPEKIVLIGGGAQSAYWRQLICDMSGKRVEYQQGGEVGPALGAAKLAQIAINRESSLSDILKPQTVIAKHIPNKDKFDYYVEQRKLFNHLYQQVAPLKI